MTFLRISNKIHFVGKFTSMQDMVKVLEVNMG